MSWILSKGVVLVATLNREYYLKAIFCANTIQEYLPDAKITLFTSADYHDESHNNLFENVITECPNEYRTKLWAMANSPYDLTLYMDCDMAVVNDQFSKVFDLIGDNDMLWTRITKEQEYAYNHKHGNNRVFPGGEFKLHGGICLYKSSAKKFMSDWYKLDKKIRDKKWWPDSELYPIRFRAWDQFSLWWLTNKEWNKYKLKYDFFPNDILWNWLPLYQKAKHVNEEDEIIIYHYSKTVSVA